MHIACDNIDTLLCVEMRRKGLPRGHKRPTFEMARAISDRPLVLAAAELLDRPSMSVGVVTGAAVPDHMPVGENDGPFGATVLAHTLTRAGHRASIITDPAAAAPIEFLVQRLGIDVPVVHLAFNDAAQQEALAQQHDLLVAIERLGGNANGEIRGINAHSRAAFRCNVDHLFRTHAALGRQSIGIGDGGNEVGFGRIYRQLVERLPELAQVEQTGCSSGIFSTVETTVLVVASTSNLGAYGVAAALALRRGDLSLCHTPAEEVALHQIGIGLGLVDGGGGGRVAFCDGIPAEANAAVVLLMRNIVEQTLAPARVRRF